MERRSLFPDRPRFRRRAAVIALAAILGATVYGDNGGFRRSPAVSPAAGALRIGATFGRAASAVARVARDAATLGILSGTVLAHMDPGVRRSILEAVNEIREVCSGRPPAPPATRCAVRKAPGKAPVRCSRA